LIKRQPERITFLYRSPLHRSAFFHEMVGKNIQQLLPYTHITVVTVHIKYEHFIFTATDHSASDDTCNGSVSFSDKAVLPLFYILFDFFLRIPVLDIFHFISIRQTAIDSIQPAASADFRHSFCILYTYFSDFYFHMIT